MKRRIFIVIMALVLFLGAAGCGGQAPEHLYNHASIHEIYGNDKATVVSTCAYAKVDSKYCTEEKINDWYFNYIKENNVVIGVIEYADQDGTGIYCMGNMVYVGCQIVKHKSNGLYTAGDVSKATLYQQKGENLVPLKF